MNKTIQEVPFDKLLVEEFMEMISDAFFFFDYSLHFTFVNKRATELTGKTKEEMLGKTVSDVFPEVKKTAIYLAYQTAKKLKDKKPFEYYSPAMKKWLSVSVIPTKLGIAVCAKDITGIKKAEEKSKENEDILNAFFENSPVALAIYDEQVKFLKIDKYSAKTFLGESASDVIGKTFQEVSPENADIVIPSLKKVIENNKTIFTEQLLQDKEGHTHYVTSSRFPLSFTNGKRGIGTITLDITDRIINEKRKDDFIAMASHELKTPLTAAKLFVEILLKKFKEAKDIQTKELLGRILEKIEDLEFLTKELLDAAVTNRGTLSMHREKFIFKDIALETIKDLQISTHHKLIVDWQTNEYLFTDKARIRQILVNFISNAIKYSPDKSDVIIRSRKDGNFVVISVQDFGIGIPKEDQAYIFDRFYQAHEHNTYPGLGLGLYIAKEIIMQIGGQIWLESDEGKGSTFYFSLPIYKT